MDGDRLDAVAAAVSWLRDGRADGVLLPRAGAASLRGCAVVDLVKHNLGELRLRCHGRSAICGMGWMPARRRALGLA